MKEVLLALTILARIEKREPGRLASWLRAQRPMPKPANRALFVKSVVLRRSFGRHLDCNGRIVEDWSKTYDHEGATYPAYRCTRCAAEILGDAEIQLLEEDTANAGRGNT